MYETHKKGRCSASYLDEAALACAAIVVTVTSGEAKGLNFTIVTRACNLHQDLSVKLIIDENFWPMVTILDV